MCVCVCAKIESRTVIYMQRKQTSCKIGLIAYAQILIYYMCMCVYILSQINEWENLAAYGERRAATAMIHQSNLRQRFPPSHWCAYLCMYSIYNMLHMYVCKCKSVSENALNRSQT